MTSFLYAKNNSDFEFNTSSVYFYGGDGSVPSISSLFAGLKWAYEKEQNVTTNGVQFVEFCSLLNKDPKYGYKSFEKLNENNQYVALGCDCLDDKNEFVLKNFEKNKCSHSTMINDKKLIGFVENLVSTEQTHDTLSEYEDSIRKAIGMYNPLLNYVDVCNGYLIR